MTLLPASIDLWRVFSGYLWLPRKAYTAGPELLFASQNGVGRSELVMAEPGGSTSANAAILSGVPPGEDGVDDMMSLTSQEVHEYG